MMTGTETFTMVTSTMIMATPTLSMARPSQRPLPDSLIELACAVSPIGCSPLGGG